MPEYDIPVGFHFRVEFGLPEVGNQSSDVRFQEVTGLSAELTTETYDEGGENRFSHRFPNRAKYGNLVLKRGMFVNTVLKRWITNAIEHFEFDPTTVTVVLLNEQHAPLASWEFTNVWPVKWAVSDFKAQDNSLIIESMELTYNYFRRIQ